MKILFFSQTVDTAGLGIGMKRAFDQYGGEHSARHVRCENSWLDYGCDIQWNRDDPNQTAEVMRLWTEADCVVLIERPLAASLFPPHPNLIVWHLGTWYRRQPELVHSQCQAIHAREVVDMHDLMRFGVEDWLPDVIDPEPLAALRADLYHASDVVRIAHAPTDRAIKSTDVIVDVVDRLSQKYPITFDLIERVPNAECLRRKATADIFIDELTLGYGLNALECWSMGIPVVSGVANPDTEWAMRRNFVELPFVNATRETLERQVEELIVSETMRRAWGIVGRRHVEAFHTPQALVRQMLYYADPVMA